MSSVEIMAADVQAPRLNLSTDLERATIAVLTITASSSVVADLSAVAQLGADVASYIWTVEADGGDVWFAFNNVSSGTVLETATTGDTRCARLANGTTRDMRIGQLGYTHLVAKGSVACLLRIYRSSKMA